MEDFIIQAALTLIRVVKNGLARRVQELNSRQNEAPSRINFKTKTWQELFFFQLA